MPAKDARQKQCQPKSFTTVQEREGHTDAEVQKARIKVQAPEHKLTKLSKLCISQV